jgi:hypothetical protein
MTESASEQMPPSEQPEPLAVGQLWASVYVQKTTGRSGWLPWYCPGFVRTLRLDPVPLAGDQATGQKPSG